METATQCPKCGFTSDTAFPECPRCGVIIGKVRERERQTNDIAQDIDVGAKNFSSLLAEASALIIHQHKEWGEIVFGFETRNKYTVMDSMNHLLFEAEEEGGSFTTVLKRIFLTRWRPFTMDLFTSEGEGVFCLKRPFRFYFHEIEIRTSNGIPLGTVRRRFSLVRRIYSVLDRNGNEIFRLFGPILHPWTFLIRKENEEEIGKITKKWSGLLKETFTDADNFGVTFPRDLPLEKKALLLGAVFLIDFVHFEK